MTRKELRELIKSTIQEYMGTGSSGGNATDGSEIPSPRPFVDDEDEIENYNSKGAPYGRAEGNHYRKEKDSGVASDYSTLEDFLTDKGGDASTTEGRVDFLDWAKDHQAKESDKGKEALRDTWDNK